MIRAVYRNESSLESGFIAVGGVNTLGRAVLTGSAPTRIRANPRGHPLCDALPAAPQRSLRPQRYPYNAANFPLFAPVLTHQIDRMAQRSYCAATVVSVAVRPCCSNFFVLTFDSDERNPFS